MSKRKSVVPLLRWHFVQKVFASDITALREGAPQMRRELRALLAVARAATRVERLHKRQWNGPGAIAREDMARALARLDALSSGSKGRGAR